MGEREKQEQAIVELTKMRDKGTTLICQLTKYLKERHEDPILRRHAIANLATLSLSQFSQELNEII